MPRIRLQDPAGFLYEIHTRQTETLLAAWFAELLPYCHWRGHEEYWPVINVWPMWALPLGGPPRDPDWLCDSRVLGRWYPFRAVDGPTGLRALLELRRQLEQELYELGPR